MEMCAFTSTSAAKRSAAIYVNAL